MSGIRTDRASADQDPLDVLLRPEAQGNPLLDFIASSVEALRERRDLLIGLALCVSIVAVVWSIVASGDPTPIELPMATGAIPAGSKPAGSNPVGSIPMGTTDAAPGTGPGVETGPDEGTETENGTVFVHVAGHVVKPGVVELRGDALVEEAIALAGGPNVFADLDRVNLARQVVDGEQIYVPAIGEQAISAPAGPMAPNGPAATADADRPVGTPVDINTADAAGLETLTGVGPKTAEAIISYRDEHGPFASVAELEEVSGIGPAKLATIAPDATVGP